MNDLLENFESELKAYLEFKYNLSGKQDTVERINETEKTAFEFVDHYLLNSPNLIAKDVEVATQRILDEFIRSKDI